MENEPKVLAKQDDQFQFVMQMIGKSAQLPGVKVNRETFLKEQFPDSPYIDSVLQHGPPHVYAMDTIRRKVDQLIKRNTRKTTSISFLTGLPGNPVLMVAGGSADVMQYFGYAIHMAQQIAYMFGEDDLFRGKTDHVSEEAKIRIIAYLGVMLGVSGAVTLMAKVAQKAGANIGKKVAGKALTKTVWYPLLKRVAAVLGAKITKKTVEKTITKSVPVIGGVVSGGITYATFRPMGGRLAKTLEKHVTGEYNIDMVLNPEFEAQIAKKNEIEELEIVSQVEEPVTG